MHPWHDIETFTDDERSTFHAVIEVPKHGRVKYELHKPTGMIQVDRILFSSVVYPQNYGFVPKTYCDDHDPLDVLVLSTEPFVPLSLVRARAIGVLRLEDEEERDDKLIAIHADDPTYRDIRDMSELPQHIFRQIGRFFAEYKGLEEKEVIVEDTLGASSAAAALEAAVALYREHETALRAGESP